MSSIKRQGKNSRKILAVAAALFAVALMIAVPVFAAVDTDAALKEDEAGYRIDLTNPTDAQLTKVHINKFDSIRDALWERNIFNDTVLTEETQKADSFNYTGATGIKITSDETTIQLATIVEAKGYEAKYNVTANDYAFIGSVKDSEKMKAAITELNLYFGKVQIGDVIKVTGDIKSEFATVSTTSYTLQDDGTCVAKKAAGATYALNSTSVKIEVIRDNSVVKSVEYISDLKGNANLEENFEYDESPVKIGTTFTVKPSASYTSSGDSYFKIGDKDYSVTEKEETPSEHKGTVTSEELLQQSSITTASYKAIIDLLPSESEEGMKIEKTYSAAESAANGVILDVVKDELKLILIIVGVVIGIIVLVVILIIVLIVLKKKKKNQ